MPDVPRTQSSMPSDSNRDFGAEHTALTDRASALPGVDEIVRLFSDYQRQLHGAAALARVAVPQSTTTTSTSF